MLRERQRRLKCFPNRKERAFRLFSSPKFWISGTLDTAVAGGKAKLRSRLVPDKPPF